MSTLEHIFIHTQDSPEDVAARISSALGMKTSTGPDNGIYLGRPAEADPEKEVGGEVARNYLAYPSEIPEEQSLLDAYEILWDFGYTGRKRDVQLTEARRAFEQLSAARMWPAVLVAGLDTLVAAWDPVLGLTWFPPGTTPDANDRSAWQGYLAQLRR
ncbi:hypothetical protein V6U81_21390 [Micromonospora sp. CPCC 205711]|uniref:hypothetical protein n=1 Tax=Micromonospora sp. CPCC 205547 TaxID=3122400 RepID=UPI002FF04328